MKEIIANILIIVIIGSAIMTVLAIALYSIWVYGRVQNGMKVVYIAHPIGGDVTGNLDKIKKIVREINITKPDVVPFVPYYADCHAMDDSVPDERERSIKNDTALLKAGFISEIWLYGDRISTGMRHEINLAKTLDIPIYAKTEGTMRAWINSNITDVL